VNEPQSVSIILESASQPEQPTSISISVRNDSDRAIWLVGVVDGAQAGRRYPKWRPHVEGPAGVMPPAETPDFTAPLRPADFRRLAPGEAFDPTKRVDDAWYFRVSAFDRIVEASGDYRIFLELDTNAPDPSAWQGTLPDRRPGLEAERREVALLLEKVPRLRVRSNVLQVSIP